MSFFFPPFSYPTGFTNYAPFNLNEVVKIPLVSNVEPGGKVLILSDTAMDPRIWHAIAQVVTELKGEPTIALFSPRPADGLDPPANVAAAMLESDLNVLSTSTAMLHCPASAKSMDNDIPSLALGYGMTAEQLCQGGALAKWEDIQKWSEKITKVYQGKNCHLTSELGTDLTYSMEGRGRKWSPATEPFKITRKAYGAKLYGEVFPKGEVNVAPVEGSANGTVVIDISMHIIKNRWLDEPVKLVIKDSKIVSIEGGRDADTLRRFLEEYGDENAYYSPAEVSVGSNPSARFIGNQKEDKNVLGAVHVGIGTNEDVGGNVRSKIHLDGVISKPTLKVDDKIVVEEGRIPY